MASSKATTASASTPNIGKASIGKVGFVLTMAEVMLGLVIVGLLIGVMLCTAEIIEISRLRSQVSQIEKFDSAIQGFFNKFDGMPGDLIYVSADREGLPTGDGTPSHSDGDGKISPCNPGWQFNIGCETALFWAQLAFTGFIDGDFSADDALSDQRLKNASVTLAPYLPTSAMGDGIYVVVWNTDGEQPTPPPRLPYGNYLEITRISEVSDEKIKETTGALTPVEAESIDDKIDDGMPATGRIMVNGNTKWPEDIWGMMAKAGEDKCVAPDDQYNTHNYFMAHRQLCHLAVSLICCTRKD